MDLTKSYYKWLTQDRLHGAYPLASKELWKLKFNPVIREDFNRADDGKFLRKDFLSVSGRIHNDSAELDIWADELGDCTMLELIASLVYRLECEFYLSISDIVDVRAELYKYMLRSLGLEYATESIEFEHVIDNFNKLNYSPTGKGSLFDMTGTKTEDIDWRIVPIWNQMLAWVTLLGPFDIEE